MTKTALLVMDFENDIVHPEGKTVGWGIPAHVEEQDAIANTKHVLETAREKGIPVIYVVVQYKKGTPELKDVKAPFYKGVQGAELLIEGEWGTQIHDELTPKEGEPIFEKHRINPFTNPKFGKALQQYDRLIITGVATNFVVEETVRQAAAENYELIILEDCCASMNAEMHNFSIEMLKNFGEVTTSKELCTRL